MDATLIQRLTRKDPEFLKADFAERAKLGLQVYLKPAFGWLIAASCARAGVPFPETLTGRDKWLFRAYMMQLNSSTYYDPHVEEAYHLSQQATGATLKAMIIVGLGDPVSEHLAIVAEKYGTSRDTVEAFEILFFNVLDRPQDGLYISNIVYPEGRTVEFEEDYFQSTPISDLILRASYNYRDIDLVLRLAGMEGESCAEELVALHNLSGQTELENKIVANALLMAQLGLLNQPSVGIQRAVTLLATSRHSRSKVNDVGSHKAYDSGAELATALDANPPITATDCQDSRKASGPRDRNYRRDEKGVVFAAGDSNEPHNSPQSAAFLEPMVRFPKPVAAIWHNKDFDKPVSLVARMSEPGLPDHYLTTENTGIPVSEVIFEN